MSSGTSARFGGPVANDLSEIACLFRVAAAQLRRLSQGRIRTRRDTTIAIEAYLYKNQMRSALAFPPDRCQETANLLEEFAASLEALIRSSQRSP
jgi:hypothetical protein